MTNEATAKDETDMTPDERMDWLRDRGVEVVTPQERQASGVATAIRDADQLLCDTVKYVLVPADTSQPLREASCTTTLTTRGVDPLLEHVKPLFASGSDRVDVTLLAQQQGGGVSNLLASSSTGDNAIPQVSHETLQQVAKEAHVETFTLVHPTPSNSMTSVVIYLDEVGMLKRLPLNARATQFCARAGYNPPPQFYGDVVMSRVQYSRGSDVTIKQPLDFSLADAQFNADWLLQAAMQNLEHQQQFNKATGTALEQPAVKGTDGAAAVEKDYSWTQTEEELEVRVSLVDENDAAAAPIGTRDITVRFASRELRVLRPKTVVIALFERVDVDSCTWWLDKNELVISLEKQEPALWPRIVD